ncbi:HCNGP-like protein-domain-containing protein [Massariosphaeria phaeospora]|uniref:HCNGP-like protein-domain-containing protein n=1 Tax=Massariosphaeria phaeospora TaxID=100035 RepID=A0A7C8MHA5_9PLEO|nr:HCNGP-like protein-domain-containing protein [Massariosphaeria phaeospora]
MLGINYESSDEDEVVLAPKKPQLSHVSVHNAPAPALTPTPTPTHKVPSVSAVQKQSSSVGSVDETPQGPAVPPPDPSNHATPGSPYTSTRSMIRNLTLPTIPNFDIPASPPGSPPHQTTQKFAKFLDLKKNGQHFHQRLESSLGLRDPGHLSRLMDFAGVNEDEQYCSSLPQDLAVPTIFPSWAYVEELHTSQKKIVKAREGQSSKTQREAIEFVSAKPGASGGTAAKTARQSATERVMGDLDKQSSRSSSYVAGKRKELERRGGRNDESSRNGSQKKSRS